MATPGTDVQGGAAQTLDRGLQVLEGIARATGSVTVADAAAGAGLDRRVTHRLIRTLAARGYLQRDAGGGYRLGPACLALASAMGDLRTLAHPFIEELAEVSGETVQLVVLSGRQVVFIAGVESRKALRVGSRTGRLLPANATSVGKAWLAALEPDQVEALFRSTDLPAVTARTITDAAALFAELDVIRRRGYATSHGESEDGVGSVGMAVRGSDGQPRLAISVAMPLERMTPASEASTAAELAAVVDRLSARLAGLSLRPSS